MKKLIVAMLVITGGIVVYKYIQNKTLPEEAPADTAQPFSGRLKQIGNHAAYQELTTTAKLPQNDTQKELIGPTNNSFGLREDVLAYIISSIPESDVKSTIAAIKMAQFDQAQIGVTSDSQLNELADKAAAASYCMELPIDTRVAFGKGYDRLLRNTPKRLAEQDRIEGLLSEHVISPDFGTNSYDRQEQCNHFLGLNQ
jgi:hypothetical protein